jgi:hypothetical protein
MQRYVRVGGFVIIPQTLTYVRRVDLQGREAAVAPQFNLIIMAAIDPRISVTQWMPPRVISAVDDKGNALGGEGLDGPAVLREMGSMMGAISSSISLLPPENPGKTFSLKGEAKFMVVVQEEKKEIADLEKHKNEPISIGGGHTLTMTRCDVTDVMMNLQFEVGGTEEPASSGKRPIISLYDATGQKMFESRVVRSSSFGMGKRQGPFKLVITIPEKVTEVAVPFEFKGLPMP